MTAHTQPDVTNAPDTAAQDPVVTLRDITITFTRTGDTDLTIIEKLDLDLRPGTLTCIAGRSGSGKTSILRVAAGLTTPTTGQVCWQNNPIDNLSPDELATARRELCGVMEQNAALIPDLTALENVLLAAVPDRRTTELRPRAVDLLKKVGLAARMKHRPAALSGGERQRVALARAQLLAPAIIIADEPTASLDRRWADTVIDTLEDQTKNGAAVLVASHDPRLIDRAHIAVPLD